MKHRNYWMRSINLTLSYVSILTYEMCLILTQGELEDV